MSKKSRRFSNDEYNTEYTGNIRKIYSINISGRNRWNPQNAPQTLCTPQSHNSYSTEYMYTICTRYDSEYEGYIM